MRHDSLYKYDCIHHVCFSFLSMKLEWKNSLLYKTHLCRFKRRRWEFRQQFIIYVNTKQQGNQLITIKITPSSINSLFKKTNKHKSTTGNAFISSSQHITKSLKKRHIYLFFGQRWTAIQFPPSSRKET